MSSLLRPLADVSRALPEGAPSGGSGQSPYPRLLTIIEVAMTLGVCTRQVYQYINRGELRAFRLGRRGHYQIHPHDLAAFLKPVHTSEPGVGIPADDSGLDSFICASVEAPHA